MMTLDKIKERLFEIKKHIRQYNYVEFSMEIDKVIDKVPIPCLLTKEIPRIDAKQYQDPTLIFRARPNKKISTKTTMKLPWTNVKDISIVSDIDKGKIKFGRANKKGEPRFYASNSWVTSCYETIWHVFPHVYNSQSLTVGVWRIIEDLILVRMPYSPTYISQLKNVNSKTINKIEQYIKDDRENITSLHNQNHANLELNEFLLDFFTDEFAKPIIKDDFDYYFSNYYCDQVFERCVNDQNKLDIDGIIFPSISYSYHNDNIVLHPRSLHKIKFIEAFYAWVVFHENINKMEFSPIHNPVHADNEGNLKWELFKE